MITKFSRIVLILTVVFVLSIIIPEYYWMAFEKHHSTPSVIYSAILKDFIKFQRINNKVFRYDNEGKIVNRQKFESLAPLYYYRTLSYLGTMPSEIDTYKVDLKDLRINTIYVQIKPKAIQTPQIKLFPLLESVPNGPKLAMPDDFFRINDKMEFIDCETNTVIPDLSEKFTKALIEHGFAFPAKKMFGNPTVMKPFDEGYFVIDAKDKLFHVKRIHNEPYVAEVPLPKGVVPVFVNVTEMELREFYGLLISETSDVYLISYDNYKLIKLPLKNYNYRYSQFRMQGNPLYRIFTVTNETSIDVIVTDRKYNFIDEYKETWANKYSSAAGKILNAFFPFTLELTSTKSEYVDFYWHFSDFTALIGMLFSLIVYFIVQFRKKEEATKCMLDYVIVFFTGIYGLIATLLIRDETWKT